MLTTFGYLMITLIFIGAGIVSLILIGATFVTLMLCRRCHKRDNELLSNYQYLPVSYYYDI